MTGPPPAKTAADGALKEFEEAENDPRHEEELKRRRGKNDDAITPNSDTQEDAKGE